MKSIGEVGVTGYSLSKTTAFATPSFDHAALGVSNPSLPTIFSSMHLHINDTSKGRRIPYSPDEKAVSIGVMFGFLTERTGQVAIANRIFEMYHQCIYILMIQVQDSLRYIDRSPLPL